MRPGQLLCGDALKLIPTLADRSVNLCLTSPPYANQRRDHYPSVAEKDYPQWMCRWMSALRPKLTDDGSVLIVIRSHVRNGVVSDYVLWTRLAIRDAGWCECEEMIWLAVDKPPLGSTHRPRRTWEHILWFSKTPKPYINLNANGGFSTRIGFAGSHRFRNGENPIATKRPSPLQNGHARTSDVFTAHISAIENGIRHAMFPVSLCEKLIQTFTKEGDMTCDPFAGSGTVLMAAQKLHRTFIGIDLNPKYVKIAQDRLAKDSVEEVGGLASALGERVRLRPEFPQRPSVRRAFLLSKGLNASDVRVFSLVLDRTVNTKGIAAVSLSLSDLADFIGLSRRTVIRAIDRLRDAEVLSTTRDDERHYHDGAMVGLHPNLLVPVVGDNKRSNGTNSLHSNRIATSRAPGVSLRSPS